MLRGLKVVEVAGAELLGSVQFAHLERVQQQGGILEAVQRILHILGVGGHAGQHNDFVVLVIF